MAAVAAMLWGVNGGVSKTILATGLSSERLAQVRSLGAALGLVAILAVTAPGRLRLTRRELPYVVTFGVGGLAFVQWFYFLAIHRLAIGIALLIEYLAPLLVALWARFVCHEHVRRRIWVALALALIGLGLIVNVFGGGTSLSTAGVLFALGGAFAYALYVLLAEHVVGDRDPVSLLAWGFLFASVFWAVLVPWWSFPGHMPDRGRPRSAGTCTRTTCRSGCSRLWMIVLGTIVAVLPARQRAPAPARDHRRDRRDARAGGRARSSAGRGSRRRSAACSSPAPRSCWRRSRWRRRPAESRISQHSTAKSPKRGTVCRASHLAPFARCSRRHSLTAVAALTARSSGDRRSPG